MQVGLQLIRECVFIHLRHPADKLSLLLAMLQKLYALVAGQCCADDPDALTHHEVLLPGQLLSKFLNERLVDSLEMFKAQARACQCWTHGTPIFKMGFGACR